MDDVVSTEKEIVDEKRKEAEEATREKDWKKRELEEKRKAARDAKEKEAEEKRLKKIKVKEERDAREAAKEAEKAEKRAAAEEAKRKRLEEAAEEAEMLKRARLDASKTRSPSSSPISDAPLSGSRASSRRRSSIVTDGSNNSTPVPYNTGHGNGVPQPQIPLMPQTGPYAQSIQVPPPPPLPPPQGYHHLPPGSVPMYPLGHPQAHHQPQTYPIYGMNYAGQPNANPAINYPPPAQPPIHYPPTIPPPASLPTNNPPLVDVDAVLGPDTSSLTAEDRQKVVDFLSGRYSKKPEKAEIKLSEITSVDPATNSTSTQTLYIVLDYEACKWKKIKRKRKG
ncbi:hypothetical protein HDU97_006244 [Phlyctochytrium planicorne]|nr:hypothetical protein HDU97_006244 [Phlyctochytrium planicorne]